MVVFTVLMDIEVAKGSIGLYLAGFIVELSHLLYADDLWNFCRGNMKSLRALEGMFVKNSAWSGLVKNKLFLSVSC